MLVSRKLAVKRIDMRTPGENHGLSPTAYNTSSAAIPLPSEQAVRQIMGKSYDPERPFLGLNDRLR
jgi:hypothetical protein